MNRKIKVLIAKPGLDGHDRGALVIAQALREAGMDVTYTGIRKTPAQIALSALQKRVDCVGLSCLSGAHNTLFPEVVRLLREQCEEAMLVIGGGVIPEADIPYLLSQGVARIFTPGTRTEEVVQYIRKHVGQKRDDNCLERAFV